MIYITKEYLNTFAFERLIDESSQDYDAALDNIEAANIELIKTYVGAIYDTEKIFNPENPIYNELLKRILAKLMLYDVFRRNAARKVPSDYKTEYDWAVKQLQDINSNKTTLGELPPLTDANGNPVQSDTIFGNFTNPDFYI